MAVYTPEELDKIFGPKKEVPATPPDICSVAIHARPPNPSDGTNYSYNDSYSFKCKIPGDTYTFYFYINQYPTFNCQLMSVGHMDYLLNRISIKFGATRERLLSQEAKDTTLFIFRKAFELMGLEPKLLLLDVEAKDYMHMIDCYFKVFHKHEYLSTNQTEMCLYMVDLRPNKTPL